MSTEYVFLASGGVQLLVGDTSGENAATALGLNWVEFDYANTATPQIGSFEKWLYGMLSKGYPVVAGFYEDSQFSSSGPDPDYDHIMPITGMTTSNGAITGIYYQTLEYDQLHYSGNPILNKLRAAFENYNKQGVVSYALPTNVNYGLALTGNKYPGLPAQLFPDSWTEPDWGIHF